MIGLDCDSQFWWNWSLFLIEFWGTGVSIFVSSNFLLCFLHCCCIFSGEALGAIGSADVLPILEKYALDPVKEVNSHCCILENTYNVL